MFYGHSVVHKSISPGKFLKTLGQTTFSLLAQSIDLSGISCLCILIFLLLPFDSLEYPFAFQSEKGNCNSVRNHIRDCNSNSF